jgi:asparagine synthase (glutamine-hydrolysing)
VTKYQFVDYLEEGENSMCGITGFIDPKSLPEIAENALNRMLKQIEHRGPDDTGIWHENSVAFGHRRLSIVDLSPLGYQPMLSENRRYVIIFNGEIYNHRLLRGQLEKRGYVFRGNSDTEVLLALVQENGLEEALRLCVGMFAIALWDRVEHALQLARVRFGEKPLYYCWQSGVLFAHWLRNELNVWAKDLLSSRKCEAILDMGQCRKVYDTHGKNILDLSTINWSILSFLAWAEYWL